MRNYHCIKWNMSAVGYRNKFSLRLAKYAFYRSANSLLGKLVNAASKEVMPHPVNSKCLPMLIYGLETCSLNKSERHSVNFTAMRFFHETFSFIESYLGH